MKLIIRLTLLIAIVLLGFLCYRSIKGPIDFEKEVKKRDAAVIQRLVDIRTAQTAYRDETGHYTASFDTLIDFVKTGKIATLKKYGDLTEEQMEAGMTEEKAMSIIRSNNEKKIKAEGLWDDANNRPQLVRDSIYSSVIEARYAERKYFTPDSLAYVPFGKGKRFEMKTAELPTASGFTMKVFEAKTPYSVYLSDLDKVQLKQKIKDVEALPGDRYPGLQVGSIETANNNAGNWE